MASSVTCPCYCTKEKRRERRDNKKGVEMNRTVSEVGNTRPASGAICPAHVVCRKMLFYTVISMPRRKRACTGNLGTYSQKRHRQGVVEMMLDLKEGICQWSWADGRFWPQWARLMVHWEHGRQWCWWYCIAHQDVDKVSILVHHVNGWGCTHLKWEFP